MFIRKLMCCLLLISMLLSAVSTNSRAEQTSDPPVIDLNNVAWAVEQIQYLVSQGIINGKAVTSEGIVFAPDDQITRAEFTKLIVKALNVQGSGSDANFNDVTPDSWYYDTVGAAYKNKIINGTSDTTFDPEDPIIRQDMFKIIVSAMVASMGKQLTDSSLVEKRLYGLNDEKDISDYARIYIATAWEQGLIIGNQDNNYCNIKPLDNTTRAEAAVVIYRMLVPPDPPIIGTPFDVNLLNDPKYVPYDGTQIYEPGHEYYFDDTLWIYFRKGLNQLSDSDLLEKNGIEKTGWGSSSGPGFEYNFIMIKISSHGKEAIINAINLFQTDANVIRAEPVYTIPGR